MNYGNSLFKEVIWQIQVSYQYEAFSKSLTIISSIINLELYDKRLYMSKSIGLANISFP